MTESMVIDVMNRGFMTVIMTAGPILVIALFVGLTIAVLQATTQVQEQTLTFVPKVLAVFFGLIVFGGYMLNNVVTLAEELISMIAGIS